MSLLNSGLLLGHDLGQQNRGSDEMRARSRNTLILGGLPFATAVAAIIIAPDKNDVPSSELIPCVGEGVSRSDFGNTNFSAIQDDVLRQAIDICIESYPSEENTPVAMPVVEEVGNERAISEARLGADANWLDTIQPATKEILQKIGLGIRDFMEHSKPKLIRRQEIKEAMIKGKSKIVAVKIHHTHETLYEQYGIPIKLFAGAIGALILSLFLFAVLTGRKITYGSNYNHFGSEKKSGSGIKVIKRPYKQSNSKNSARRITAKVNKIRREREEERLLEEEERRAREAAEEKATNSTYYL